MELDLTHLRKRITEQQCEMLTSVWNYFREHTQWMPVRRLHQIVGGKQRARPALEQLGGSIIFERVEQNGTKSYELTFLGVLLTEAGEQYEQLLADYLAYVTKLGIAEPTRTHITSQEAAAALSLNPEQLVMLGHLIHMGLFFSLSMGGYGTEEWNAGIPEDIEDLPEDLRNYVRERTMLRYDQNVPLVEAQRREYLWSKQIASQLGRQEDKPSQETVGGNDINLLLESVASATSADEKGKVLEELMCQLFKTIPGFTVEHRVRTSTEEIDIIILNNSDDPRIRREAAIILAECKNWAEKCGKNELVIFQQKVKNRSRRCSLGIFISWSGFKETFEREQLRGSQDEFLIIPLTGDDIRLAVNSGNFYELLIKAWDKAIFM